MNLIPLSWRLKRLSQTATPSREFALRLQSTLRERGAFASPRPVPRSSFGLASLRFAGVALCLVVLLGTGTGAYAYTSDEVLPDHPLYPVRQSIENTEEVLAITPAWKERVRKKHLARKHKEIQRMLEHRSDIERVPEREVLLKVDSILREGIEGKRNPDDVRDAVLKEMQEVKTEDLRPAARHRLLQIQKRIERMQRLQKR